MEDPLIFDKEALLKNTFGDVEQMQSLLEFFFQEIPKQIVELRGALDSGDPEAVRIAAHTIKGSALTFRAPALAQAAGRVEMAGKSKDVDLARNLFLDIGLEFNRLQVFAKKELRADSASQ